MQITDLVDLLEEIKTTDLPLPQRTKYVKLKKEGASLVEIYKSGSEYLFVMKKRIRGGRSEFYTVLPSGVLKNHGVNEPVIEKHWQKFDPNQTPGSQVPSLRQPADYNTTAPSYANALKIYRTYEFSPDGDVFKKVAKKLLSQGMDKQTIVGIIKRLKSEH
jgi:hypothetical protein